MRQEDHKFKARKGGRRREGRKEGRKEPREGERRLGI
jgi:hypothetical protein